MSVFGPIIRAGQVEKALVDTIKYWLPTYLREIERLTGRTGGALATARSYTVADGDERFPEAQLPAVIVAADKIVSVERHATYSVTWDCAVAVVVESNSDTAVRTLAQDYLAAIRTLLVQNPGLRGFAQDLSWQGEDLDALANDKRRSLAVGVLALEVTVADVADPSTGPSAPAAAPIPAPSDYMTADEVDITVTPS